jgi:hypothetical protein
MHTGAEYDGTARAEAVAADLAAHPIPVAHRIQLGDLTDSSPHTDSLPKALLDGLPEDWSAPMGNHDMFGRSSATASAAYGLTQNYTRDLGFAIGVFTAPDANVEPYTLSAATLEWMEAQFKAARRPVIWVNHNPLMHTVVGAGPGVTENQYTPTLAFFAINPDRQIRELLNEYPIVKLAISGHTHNAKDCYDLIKRHVLLPELATVENSTPVVVPNGDFSLGLTGWQSSIGGGVVLDDLSAGTDFNGVVTGLTNLVPEASGNLKSLTNWLSEVSGTGVTKEKFELSTAWSGESAGYFKATCTAAKKTAQVWCSKTAATPGLFVVTPGTFYHLKVDTKIVQKPATGQTFRITWYTAANAAISSVDSPAVTATGEQTLTVTALAPAGAAYCRMRLCNSETLQSGDVSEFYWRNVRGYEITVAVHFLLHLKAHATGTSGAARFRRTSGNKELKATPGKVYAYAADLNVTTKGAAGPNLAMQFLTESGEVLDTFYGNQATGTGKFRSEVAGQAPSGSAYVVLYVGNQSTTTLAAGETLEFTCSAILEGDAGLLPAGTRDLITINASATAYTGTEPGDSDPLVSLFLGWLDDEIKVFARNHGTHEWTTIQGAEAVSMAIPDADPPKTVWVSEGGVTGQAIRWVKVAGDLVQA